jgi:hypothetical protein
LRLKANTPGEDALSTFIMMGLLLITIQKKNTSIHGSRCNKLPDSRSRSLFCTLGQ